VAVYLARANLTLDGQLIEYGAVVPLEATEEVLACVEAKFLLPQNEDGTFAEPPDPPRRCCGG
jgi:hypothetical protein